MKSKSITTSRPVFWGLHAIPSRWAKIILGLLPFLFLAAIYMTASHYRHAENDQDKLLPGISELSRSAWNAAFVEDRRKGTILLWSDTASSLKRLVIGVGGAAMLGLGFGVSIGLFPGLRAMFAPFLSAVAMVPPLAVLPILFITLGVDELAKIALIIFGLFALIARDMDLAVGALPSEQKTKALTLGAGGADIVLRVVLPQVLPRLIDSVRLSLGAAWLFVIAAEAIAAESGLGYRIFLVRRYLDMATILPYVAWITVLGFSMDLALRWLNRAAFPWYAPSRDK